MKKASTGARDSNARSLLQRLIPAEAKLNRELSIVSVQRMGHFTDRSDWIAGPKRMRTRSGMG